MEHRISFEHRFSCFWGNLTPCLDERPTALFFDEGAFLHHGAWAMRLFPKARTHFLVREKTERELARLQTALFQDKWPKDSLFIAFGGGSCLDLTAYLASTYLRGVSLQLIPTTLLAMVDAAIGGKTGIDTPFGKNSLGTFWFPEKISFDPAFLSTLSQEALLCGLAEMLKLGLATDRDLWDLLKPPVPSDWLPWIQRSVEKKLEIVLLDPLEKTGTRELLNFGHTLGHALELAGGWPHGIAVALGCLAESFFSSQEGLLPKGDWEEIQERYRLFGYTFPPLPPLGDVRALLRRDKKSRRGNVRAILLERIGKAAAAHGIEIHNEEAFLKAIELCRMSSSVPAF